MNPDPARNPASVLFNPFYYLAGAKALLFGLLAILLAGLAGAFSRTHFDGVLDVHAGAHAPLWLFLAEGFIDWLCMAALLLAAGAILAKTAFRVVDVLGTQALARWPTIFLGFVMLPSGVLRFGAYLLRRWSQPATDPGFSYADAAVFFAATLAIVLLVVWVVVLMYRAFSVSCNVRGAKAVGAFIAVLVAAEALSKIAIISLASLASPRIVAQTADTSSPGVAHDGAQVVELMAKGDFAAVAAQFDATMLRVLPEAKLRGVWLQLQEQVGPFKNRLQSRITRQQGYDIVFVTCRFERATLDAKVVFDSQRKIAGLFFVPSRAADTSPPPSPSDRPGPS